MAMDVERWILLHLAGLAGEPADSLDRSRPMGSFDVDSFDAVEMAFAIEKAFGVEVDPEFFLIRVDTLDQVIARVRLAIAADVAVTQGDMTEGDMTPGDMTLDDPHAV